MTDAFDSHEFEMQIRSFEQAWQQGNSPAFVDFLPATLSIAERVRLLRELVCIDLEYRWQNHENIGTPPQVEHYLRQFAELSRVPEVRLELIGEEYRVRSQNGDKPGTAEFLVRFPQYQGDVTRVILQVDRELEAEADIPPRPSTSVTPFTAFDPQAPLPFSDYVLRRIIGVGRMGKVYYAWQRSLDRFVAVKFLRKAFLEDQQAVQRFLQEARTVARLQHPHIVGVHGLGRTSGGGYFLVMDWIDGSDLADVIRTEEVTVADAVRWTIQACAGIEEAHRHGIVHCDLKPGNILRNAAGLIRVTDFGLARSLADDNRTDEGISGTAPYMAPEQVSGFWGSIDPRTDVYGLGGVLFALLTGRPPWTGQTLADILADVVSAAPAPSPETLRGELPAALIAICRRCLAKSPEQRFANVAELRQALASIE